MDVSEVDNAAEGPLVSEALRLIVGMLDDMLDNISAIDRGEYDDDLERLRTLASLMR